MIYITAAVQQYYHYHYQHFKQVYVYVYWELSPGSYFCQPSRNKSHLLILKIDIFWNPQISSQNTPQVFITLYKLYSFEFQPFFCVNLFPVHIDNRWFFFIHYQSISAIPALNHPQNSFQFCAWLHYSHKIIGVHRYEATLRLKFLNKPFSVNVKIKGR